MRNWLIRILGGVTREEISSLESGNRLSLEIKDGLIKILSDSLERSEGERKELNQLFLQKAGFIPRERSTPAVSEILNPINTRNKTWLALKRTLEEEDAKKVEERWRKKDPNAVGIGGQNAG